MGKKQNGMASGKKMASRTNQLFFFSSSGLWRSIEKLWIGEKY
jgi:hypothetical protein